MIINIAHTKGGVGKTTIAVNLAILLNADLLDLDMQNSSIKFSTLGPKRDIRFMKGQNLAKADLQRLADIYQGSKEQHLVVDSGGYDSDTIRYMLAFADLVITPLAPSQVELFGLQEFDGIVKKVKEVVPDLKSYILFDRVTQFQTADIEALRGYLQQTMPEFGLLKTTLGSRKAFGDAYAKGLSVNEFQPASKAASEMNALVDEIKEIVRL